jgi:hypothetical protein
MKRWLGLIVVASCVSEPKPPTEPAASAGLMQPKSDVVKTTADLKGFMWSARTELTGFVWPVKGVIAEGVAFDPETRNFFISSVRERKIWRVTPEGEFRLVLSGVGGPSPFGMTFDRERGCLWAAFSDPTPTRANPQVPKHGSGIHRIDLVDPARLDARYLRNDGEEHVLGDLVLGPDRAIWVTDSKTPALYRLDPDAANWSLVPVRIGEGWKNPQGLAFDDRGALFVSDYSRGIVRVELATDTSFVLPGSEDRLRGVDGIYWHEGALHVIQNGTKTPRVLRVTLNEARDAVANIDVLLEGPPLDDPTLGVFAEGAFFVNAVSGWGDWTETGERTERPLSEHRLLRIDLEPRR